MPKYNVPIDITADSTADIAPLVQAIETLLRIVKPADLVKLAAKVKAKPSLVTTALKFI